MYIYIFTYIDPRSTTPRPCMDSYAPVDDPGDERKVTWSGTPGPTGRREAMLRLAPEQVKFHMENPTSLGFSLRNAMEFSKIYKMYTILCMMQMGVFFTIFHPGRPSCSAGLIASFYRSSSFHPHRRSELWPLGVFEVGNTILLSPLITQE